MKRSTRAVLSGVGLVAVLSGGLVARALAAAPATAGEITYLTGEAQRQAGGTSAKLAQGTKVFQGDRLKTSAGARLEAKLADGSLLRLGEKSELVLAQVDVNKQNTQQKKIQAKLYIGKVWAAVTSLFGSESKFEVTTENAVAGVRGTRFQASRAEDGATTVKVYAGKVLVSNKPVYQVEGATKSKRVQVAGPQEISKKQWEETVASAMQFVQVTSAGALSPAKPFEVAQDDEWEKWNAERDQVAGVGGEGQ